MSEDQTVTQADERAADEWYPDRSSPMHRKLAKLLARHRAAHSGEGRSNGAGKALSGLDPDTERHIARRQFPRRAKPSGS